MKKAVCLLLAAMLLAVALTGCGSKKTKSIFTADNEIVTYLRIDPAKTQIVVGRTGNLAVEGFCKAFEALNPDVQVIYQDITGGNQGYKPLNDWVTGGYAPDVMIAAFNFFDEDLTVEYFENLSADPIIENFEAEALKRTAVNDEVYSLPGPSNINAMMYNKTLFAEYGWEVPKTFEEFVSLCDRIREDTGGEVQPWNPNAKYTNELLTVMEAFVYEEIFGGAENRAWYNGCVEGNETFSGHMEPYTEALQTLIDHGILTEEHFSYSATTRGQEFAAGKIAMINMNIYNADNEQFDFGYMPFPTTAGELGYICSSYSCYLGVPKKEHTEEQANAIRRFMDYFSTSEGQQVFIGNTMQISNVKGMQLNRTEDLAALSPAIEAGHMFEVLTFGSKTVPRSRIDLHQVAMDMAAGLTTGAECLAAADNAAVLPASAAAEEPQKVVASAEKDMTVLETSFYIADAYREAAGADIGLITHNEAYRGNMMRIFAGELTKGFVNVLKPRSFANDSTLLKVSMTGSQLLEALNNPVGNESTANCIYAYSGLQCSVAPWNELGGRYLSVKLADGKALEEDKLYSVAIWAGTVADEYITEVLQTYEGSWEEHMTAKLTADGIVTPANDDRIKLIWEQAEG